MNQHQQRLLNEPRVQVIAKAKENTANKVRLVLFSFAFFSFIYFFSGTLWRALVGG
jgi:hypothetical protein